MAAKTTAKPVSPSATVDQAAGTLTIVLPLLPPRASKSGKNLTIATTNGNMRTDAMVDGAPVTIGVNAYVPNPNR